MRRSSALAVALVLAAACSPSEKPPAPPSAPVSRAAPAAGPIAPGGVAVKLPKQAGAWTRPDAPRRITAETIFDYMDGAGELYLAYRFGTLEVVEYTTADASLGTILVECYAMKTSDDAFGLLSTDWGGEVVPSLEGPALPPSAPAMRPSSVRAARALYGAGLLRIWADTLYARVLASRESPASREAVLAIGEGIVAGRPARRAPGLVFDLPLTGTGGHALRTDRTCFFRSHLVLNSAYFLASSDILGLGPEVEGVTSEYRSARPGERPVRLILVRYPAEDRAAAALATFRREYVPEAKDHGAPAGAGTARTEHGWVGWNRGGRHLAIVLDAAAEGTAREMAAGVLRSAQAR